MPTLSFEVDEDLIIAIDEARHDERLSRSAWVRRLIATALLERAARPLVPVTEADLRSTEAALDRLEKARPPRPRRGQNISTSAPSTADGAADVTTREPVPDASPIEAFEKEATRRAENADCRHIAFKGSNVCNRCGEKVK